MMRRIVMSMILMEIQIQVVMNPFVFTLDLREKTPESPSDDDTNDVDNRSDVTIKEPVAQEIERQSDPDSYKSADSGSDGEDGCVSTHSTPLALRRSARQRKLPDKYDGFIIGPLRQLSVILENKFLGEVYTEHYAQMCVKKSKIEKNIAFDQDC